MARPLFIPLKKEYFEQYKNGTKKYELRKPERQFQLKYLTPGRDVTLSCGYSGDRLYTKIGGAELWHSGDLGKADRKACLDCFGQHGEVVKINFDFDEVPSDQE
ncbi:hypothetical protein [Maridesulfovibrio sp.]|uniref:hypothetical protein n=1 Tax=Maridesulfovibrio sp. TaxID=2795000 RepID=UPI0029CA1908|nr:hypothetical protein [Maridesulfovibrio sp.]